MKKIVLTIAGLVVVGLLALVGSIALPFLRYAPAQDGMVLPGGAILVAGGGSNVYILPEGPAHALLVDCGMDPKMTAVAAALKKKGMGLDAVVAVLITHAHPDHIGGCGALPNAKLYSQLAEVAAIEGRATVPGPLSSLMGAAKPTGLHVARGLGDGEQGAIGIYDITAYAVPGHTPGSGAWLIGPVLYAGDAAAFGKDGKLMRGPWIFNSDGQQAAASITGKSKDEVGATNRLNQALKVIDTFPCETHFLDITPRGFPATPVPLNKLKAALAVWMGKLKPHQQSTVPFRYVHDGLTIRVTAFPKSKPKAGRSIAVRHFPVQTTTFDENLRDAVEKKAKKYGKLEMPYLIAANTFPFIQTETDIMDSLLGTSFTQVAMMKDGSSKQEELREPNGVWKGPEGARNQVVSAVLAMKDILPWNFAAKIARLVRNPWATTPLPVLPLGVHETNPIEGIWKKTKGKTMGEIFNLPDGWPEA